MIHFFDRLDKYMISIGFNDNQLTIKCGLSNGILGKARKRGALSQDNISKILRNCPDLNANWLFTGEGPMLKTDQQIGDISSSTVVGSNVSGNGNQITHNDFAGMIELQKGYQQLLNRKDEQINRLLAIIERTQGINEK